MTRYEVHGLLELNGAGCPAVEFRLTVPADDETQARAAILPLLGQLPRLVHGVTREACAPPAAGPICIGCGCDELHACRTEAGHGCSWVMLRPELGAGLCSECAEGLGLDVFALQHAMMFWRPPEHGTPLIQIVRPGRR